MSLAARDLPRRMTADEFFATTDELPRAQLIDGVLVVPVNGPSYPHQVIVTRLVHGFMTHAETHPGAGHVVPSVDLRVTDDTVLQPDLLWLPDGVEFDRSTAPPLTVEILSPSTRRYDLGAKMRHYLAAGVQEVWAIEQVPVSVTVHRADAEPAVHTDVVTTPLVPGWAVEVSALGAR